MLQHVRPKALVAAARCSRCPAQGTAAIDLPLLVQLWQDVTELLERLATAPSTVAKAGAARALQLLTALEQLFVQPEGHVELGVRKAGASCRVEVLNAGLG